MDNAKIIFVGGGKGGVGKTTVTLAVVDTLIERNAYITVIETDSTNPDAYKSLKNIPNVKCEICNLDSEEGYINLGSIIEKTESSYIVVNTAARIMESIIQNGYIISDVAKALNMEILMLWPINRQKDSIELLTDFIESDFSESFNQIHVVKNGYFGTEDKFLIYDSAKVKNSEKIKSTVFFPELNDLIADKIINKRLALSNACSELTMTEVSVLNKYRRSFKKIFDEIL